MAVNEEIVTGRKFRKLVDEATKLWQRISFWTKAVDVEFNDNKTAETKLGAIDGITDSLVSTSSRIAASAKAISTLKSSFQAGVNALYDKCVACGVTPAGKTPTDIVNAMQSIYTNRYNAGVNAGKNQSKSVRCYSTLTYDSGKWRIDVYVKTTLIKTFWIDDGNSTGQPIWDVTINV